MSLQTSIKHRLDILFHNFLCTISDHYDIDYDELCTFVDTVNFTSQNKDETKKNTCLHIMSSGKNKGKPCPSKALDNGYCRKHQATAGVTGGTLSKKTVKTKEMTKTQLQIIDWLNTAVPNEETVLKRRSKGLLNEETDILFNDDHVVIGKLDDKKIEKLSAFEIEICEKHGWQYKDGIIESDEED